jgi:hypothetical protein
LAEWSIPKPKRVVMKRKTKVPPQPTRQSARIAKDDIPISEKAAKRVEGLNNLASNSFSLLSSVDSSYLKDLVVDIGVGVAVEGEDFENQLDSCRAQEAAQQAIDRFEKERINILEEKDKLEENNKQVSSNPKKEEEK